LNENIFKFLFFLVKYFVGFREKLSFFRVYYAAVSLLFILTEGLLELESCV
jgi:hypothetical protein